MSEEMSIYDCCKLSQDIQMASNPHAVVNELGRVMRALSKHGLSTDQITSHCSVICLIDKLCSLSGIQFDTDKVFKAYKNCMKVLSDD